jgi:hypothetical protein
VLQRLPIIDTLQNLVGQVVELWQVWLHGLAEIGAFWEFLDKWKRQVKGGAGDKHTVSIYA